MMFKKTERYIYRNVAGEGILVPVKDGICNMESLLILNETSTAVWEWMQNKEKISRSEVVEWMLDEYDAERSQVESDIDKFLQESVDTECLCVV